MSLTHHLDPSPLGSPFSLADLGRLLVVYKVLDDAVQVCIAPGQEQNIVSSDGGPSRMAAEALEIYCNVLCVSCQNQ
jgi:hypothetical protein